MNLKVYNCLTGNQEKSNENIYVELFATGVVKKYPTHAGKHVVTGAMVVSNDAILCGGYDEDQGTSYINGIVVEYVIGLAKWSIIHTFDLVT